MIVTSLVSALYVFQILVEIVASTLSLVYTDYFIIPYVAVRSLDLQDLLSPSA